jgi:hypothetical protein
MKTYLVLAILAGASALGACGKKDEPRSAAPAPPLTKQEAQRPVEPTPALPPPTTTPAKDVELPKPGQANDHSNPAFKGGGTPDPKK